MVFIRPRRPIDSFPTRSAPRTALERIYWELFVFIGLISSSSATRWADIPSTSKRNSRESIARETPISELMTDAKSIAVTMTISDEVAIQITDLNKWFGTFRFCATFNLTVNRRRADRHAADRSGSGKSTLIPLHQPG